MKKVTILAILIFSFSILTVQAASNKATAVMPDVTKATANQQLFTAIQQNNLKIVKALIEKNIDSISVNIYKDKSETETALTLSIGNPEIMSYLIKEGANVNATVEQSGWSEPMRITPLIKSVYKKDFDSIKILVNHGANVNYETAQGFRALDLAITNDSSPQIIMYLLKNGAKVNYKTTELGNYTPLIAATKNQNLPIVQLLLTLGANPTLTDANNQTALDYAIKTGNKTLINLLTNK